MAKKGIFPLNSLFFLTGHNFFSHNRTEYKQNRKSGVQDKTIDQDSLDP